MMKKIGISLFVAVMLAVLSLVLGFKVPNGEECPPDETLCEFYLEIEERLVVRHEDTVEVPLSKNGNCKMGRYNILSNTCYMEDEGESVVYMDGFYRSVIAVNKSIPGPPIIVYSGQIVRVRVHNLLLTEGITIHWHGMHQNGTGYMDGVAYVNQCPILPDQYFDYEFKASPSGTFFYHSHIGGQRIDGMFGGLIVKRREERPLLENVTGEFIMHVGDWYHKRASMLYAEGVYRGIDEEMIDGSTDPLPGLAWTSSHIEGRGRYYDEVDEHWHQAPMKFFNVMKDKKYRFRVINAGTVNSMRVSVDKHDLHMIATDGYDVEEMVVESFFVNPGERFDFYIVTNQAENNNYYIRSNTLVNLTATTHATIDALAILKYEGAPDHTINVPTSTRQCGVNKGPCKVLNCKTPNKDIDPAYNIECVYVNELRSSDDEDDRETVPMFGDGFKPENEIFITFSRETPGNMALNGFRFVHPPVSSLTQHEDIDEKIRCKKRACERIMNQDGTSTWPETCKCYHEIDLKPNEVYQFVFLSNDASTHPVHVHGHSFHVVHQGTGNRDAHIKFTDESRYQGAWRNESMGGDHLPGLDKIHPKSIQKDTVMLTKNGYVVVRFRTNNPGKWFFHCHIEFHAMDGMALVINESLEHHPEAPENFPRCNSFLSDHGDEDEIQIQLQDDIAVFHNGNN